MQLYKEYRSGQLDSAGLTYEAQSWDLNYKEFLGLAEEASGDDAQFTYFAPRNPEGGATAAIETWCAVNRNTKYPEDAFFITDILLSEKFLNLGMLSWNPNSTRTTLPLFGSAGYGCIPVHPVPLSSNIAKFRSTRISGGQRAALKEARESVTYAYFTRNVDRELNHMFEEFMEMVRNG